jgi:hypothetical protein
MFATSPPDRTEASQVWVPVAAFVLTGVLAAFVLASSHSAESRKLAVTLWSAFGQVIAVAVVSALVARFTLASFTRWEGEERIAFALLFGALGAWFVPLAFLAVKHRFWTLLAAALLGWAAGRLTRRCGHAGEPSSENGPERNRAHLFLCDVTASVPKAAIWPMLAAALVELSLYAVVGGSAPRGALLAGGGGFLLGVKAAPAIAPAPFRAQRIRRWMQLATSILGAFLLTSFLTVRLPGGGGGGLPRDPSIPARRVARNDLITGAILMGKPVSVVKLIAPPPAQARSGPSRALRPPEPMTIEFSGVYWVLGPRHRRPDAASMIVRETPLDYRFTMTDRTMLFMQARQELPQAIDPRCCSHLELAINNADLQPRTIMLEVELAFGEAGRAQRVSLGKQRITAIGPVTLRYPIPASAASINPDLIIVTYHLYMPRTHRSANLEIERFVFVPRTW